MAASHIQRQLGVAQLQIKSLELLLEEVKQSASLIDGPVVGQPSSHHGGAVTLSQMMTEHRATSSSVGTDKSKSWASVARAKGIENTSPVKMPEPPVSEADKPIYEMLKKFALDPSLDLICTPPGYTSDQRRRVHKLAALFGFNHQSVELPEQDSHKSKGKGKGKSQRSHRHQKIVKVSKKKQPPASPKKKSVEEQPPTDWDEEQLGYHKQLTIFIQSDHSSLDFPSDLESAQRRKLHEVAEFCMLKHESIGPRQGPRFLRVTKIDPEVLAKRRQNAKLLQVALEAHRQMVKDAAKINQSVQKGDAKPGASSVTETNFFLRYMNWNIEWMNYMFKSDTEFNKKYSDVSDCHALCKSIAAVIKDINPDLLAVEEGPKNLARMQLFVDKYLDGKYNCFGALDEGNDQQVFILVSKNGPIKHAEIYKEADDYLQQPWLFDVDGDFTLDEYTYTRRPVVVRCEVELPAQVLERADCFKGKVRGTVKRNLYACAMHAKSKFISGGERLWKSSDPARQQQFIEKAVKNRRRIHSECSRLRKCINETIYRHEDDPLVVVSGDINDGPTTDLFEDYYVLTNCVDALLGSPFDRSKLLRAPLISSKHVAKEDQWTCVFNDYVADIPGKKVLLDHICVSDAVWCTMLRAGIGHEVFARHSSGHSRQHRPSDHRPVYADLF